MLYKDFKIGVSNKIDLAGQWISFSLDSYYGGKSYAYLWTS